MVNAADLVTKSPVSAVTVGDLARPGSPRASAGHPCTAEELGPGAGLHTLQL